MEASGEHNGFCIQEAGLKIPTENSHVAASPDRMFACPCHGEGVIEVKCPFSHRYHTVQEATNTDKEFCLEEDSNNNLILKKSHSYYYQVQTQLLVTKRKFCIFVVWTLRSCFCTLVYFDQDLVERLVVGSFAAFKLVFLPELIGEYFSKTRKFAGRTLGDTICYCRGPLDQRKTVLCAGQKCPIAVFHRDCLEQKRVTVKWSCDHCKHEKLTEARKRKRQ